MALTQEEIRIRAGLDYSKVTAGLATIKQQVTKMATGIPSVLSSMLRTSLIGIGLGIAKEIMPTWESIWNSVYGVDEAGQRRLDAASANLKKLRKTIQDSQKELSKTMRDQSLDEADNLGKAAILEGELSIAQRNLATAKEALKFAKDHNLSVEERAQAQLKVTNAINEQLKAEKALRDTQKKFTPGELESEFNRKLDATRGQVVRDRKDIAIARDNPGDPFFQKIEADALGRIGAVVQARNIKGLGSVANALPDVAMFAGMKEALLLAQQEAMKATIQKVSIVEIK